MVQEGQGGGGGLQEGHQLLHPHLWGLTGGHHAAGTELREDCHRKDKDGDEGVCTKQDIELQLSHHRQVTLSAVCQSAVVRCTQQS